MRCRTKSAQKRLPNGRLFFCSLWLRTRRQFPANSPLTQNYVQAPIAGPLAIARDAGYADESTDFGITPIDFPRSRSMGYGAPTPTTIPGAKVLTTKGLMDMRATEPKPALFVVYNAKAVIPGAIVMDGAGEDRLLGPDLDKFTKLLAKQTDGDKSKPVIFYCHGPKCWLSYNAVLHAKEAGYTNVFWYRGGRDAWKAAGKKFKKPKGEEAQDDD